MLLLAIGLAAYSTIPNVHRTPVSNIQPVLLLDGVTVDGAHEYVREVLFQSGTNELQANFTLVAQRGDLYPMRFRLFPENATLKCATPRAGSFLFDNDISNQTLNILVRTPGAYCFVFNNEASPSTPTAKTLSANIALRSTHELVSTSNDGTVNMAGVGLGAFGLLVLAYGASRKTVIPWE